jgi:hypothetical protein
MAWLRCLLPRREPVDPPVARGCLDGCGAIVGGEVITGGKASDRADVTDDGRGDDRAGAVELTHARSRCGDDLGQSPFGGTALRVDATQVLEQLVRELESCLSDRVGRLNAGEDLRGLDRRYVLGKPAGDEVAEHRMQPAHNAVTGPAQITMAPDPDFHHRGVILGCYDAHVG